MLTKTFPNKIELALSKASERTRQACVAFITTPRFRSEHASTVRQFVYSYMYPLCNNFSVACTGTTYQHILELVASSPDDESGEGIAESLGHPVGCDADLRHWRATIRDSMIDMGANVQGMIQVARRLVEGRLDGVIHLTDTDDVTGKADSMVLRREANVHDVPIASDMATAQSMIESWMARIIKNPEAVFPPRTPIRPDPLRGIKLSDRVIALIAHNGVKLELLKFFVEYAPDILGRFDYVLATGTTGSLLRQFARSLKRSPGDVRKIRMCLSGPIGGDVQIASAIVEGLCRKVIFFQDPLASHPHDVDIRLFEQAVLSPGIQVELATNPESARLILV